MNIIQIGCNNCEDHVFDFISSNKDAIKKFLIIDALPDCVSKAKNKYSFLGEKLIAVNCAVANSRGVLNFFYPKNDSLSPHASLLQSHVSNHLHQNIESISVPCLHINDIIDSFVEQVDRLYIDIEGLDVITLLSLDYSKLKPKYIEYEFCHADGSFTIKDNSKKLIDLLTNNNYELSRCSEYNISATLKV